MSWTKLASKSQIRKDPPNKITLGDKVFLVVQVKEDYYALNDRCPHLGGSLSEGKLEEETIICPKHGSRFDVKSGQALRGPKILFLNFKVKNATSYPLKVEGEDLYIDL